MSPLTVALHELVGCAAFVGALGLYLWAIHRARGLVSW